MTPHDAIKASLDEACRVEVDEAVARELQAALAARGYIIVSAARMAEIMTRVTELLTPATDCRTECRARDGAEEAQRATQDVAPQPVEARHPADHHPDSGEWLRITGREPNKKGELIGFDEIVNVGEVTGIHIERMADSHYWMRIDGPSGKSQRVEFWAKRGRIFSGTERE